MTDIFQPSVKKREVAFRGQFRSRDYNAFMDEVLRDHASIATSLNSLSAEVEKLRIERENELRDIKAFEAAQRNRKTNTDLIAAHTSADITYYQNFADLDDISYEGVNTDRQLRIYPVHNSVSVPFNSCVSRLYDLDPRTRDIYIPDDLSVSITAVDEGSDGSLYPDVPALAVDGKVGQGFLRKISYDSASDRVSVTMDVTIDVPSLYASAANFLTLFPTPAGTVDVLGIWYSTTTSAPTNTLPNFTAQNDVHAVQVHFEPINITKIKVRLRQRRWIIEQTEKLFSYGIRELHLDLVELDKTDSGAGFNSADNIAIAAISCPSGYTFSQIKEFGSTPSYGTVLSDNGIYFELFQDEALSTPIVGGGWDSYNDTAIDYTNALTWLDVSGSSISTVYVGIKLAYNTSLSVSPILNSLYMVYSVT